MNQPPSLQILQTGPAELDAVLRVQRQAFEREDEALLVAGLLVDSTAQPSLSLLACSADRPIGHVLCTHVTLAGAPRAVAAAILAPLAVVPASQGQGVGRTLIAHSASLLAARGVQLLFVLGDPAYYTRHGFEPAIPHGLIAPYPILPEAAWMVRALEPGVLGPAKGTVACATALNKPEYWRE
jgi:putative acetyltransferase